MANEKKAVPDGIAPAALSRCADTGLGSWGVGCLDRSCDCDPAERTDTCRTGTNSVARSALRVNSALGGCRVMGIGARERESEVNLRRRCICPGQPQQKKTKNTLQRASGLLIFKIEDMLPDLASLK